MNRIHYISCPASIDAPLGRLGCLRYHRMLSAVLAVLVGVWARPGWCAGSLRGGVAGMVPVAGTPLAPVLAQRWTMARPAGQRGSVAGIPALHYRWLAQRPGLASTRVAVRLQAS